MKKLPITIATETFMEGNGDMLSNPAGLKIPLERQRYLRNRIEQAFLAGWRAAEARITKPYDEVWEGRITPGM